MWRQLESNWIMILVCCSSFTNAVFSSRTISVVFMMSLLICCGVEVMGWVATYSCFFKPRCFNWWGMDNPLLGLFLLWKWMFHFELYKWMFHFSCYLFIIGKWRNTVHFFCAILVDSAMTLLYEIDQSCLFLVFVDTAKLVSMVIRGSFANYAYYGLWISN